jgi:hypothetical protein
MSKRLYQITDTQTGKPVPAQYYSDKMSAKAARRDLNGEDSDTQILRFVVSPGPDHKNYAHGRN